MEKTYLPGELISIFTAELAWHYRTLPFSQNDEKLIFNVGIGNKNPSLQTELEFILDKEVELKPISEQELENLLIKYYPVNTAQKSDIDKNISYQGNFYGENLLMDLIREAKETDCSDIHFEPFISSNRVRFRLDGKLIERMKITDEEFPYLINKIKIMSGLDISEKRLPQDGKIHLQNEKDYLDIRVSIIPVKSGEKAVLRLLTRNPQLINIHTIGFSEDQKNSFIKAIHKPNGLILISGPTGSGKTTTLYALLNELNQINRNIITVEDPVEYTLSGVNQVQVKEEIGLSFDKTLESFLRQDPDVIMVGEIRNRKTAEIAVRASLTGHLVLSTVHTNSAWGTINRLLDMGIEPWLLATSLRLTAAQRLIRLLCPHCKMKVQVDYKNLRKDMIEKISLNEHFVAEGCQKCYYTGYSGRKAVFEVIEMDEFFTTKIKEKDFHEINDLLNKKGINRMEDQAIQLYQNGETSREEIMSVFDF